MTMTAALQRPQMTDFNKAAHTTIHKGINDHDNGSSGGCG
jgi:hypothetical protein